MLPDLTLTEATTPPMEESIKGDRSSHTAAQTMGAVAPKNQRGMHTT